ncbi:MAG: glycosidase, partial [Hyphomicrobiaceae bacterium]
MSQAMFLNRQTLYLRPDPARVVVRPFKPAIEPKDLNPADKTRANRIVGRVLSLEPDVAEQQLAEVLENFEGRHRNLLHIFEARAVEMEEALEPHAALSKTQRYLVGAYFLHEYSFEASALFNPSIVRHPDQSDAPNGGCRFILSLRAVGEGHISSLTFRSGSIAANGSVAIDATARLASIPKVTNRTARPNGDDVEVIFGPDEDLSERVIFPITDAQANGIEDARFVEFEDEGRRTFYATYTAYSGRGIRSELLETTDFRLFRLTPLSGTATRNKG